MNFLALCQRLRSECGIAGTGPSTVLNQSGELLRIVNWVAQAYTDICAKHTNWKFLRSSFSVNTVADQEAYVPTDCTDTELSALIGSTTVGAFAKWMPDTFRIYLQSAGVATRQNFWPSEYEYFRETYRLQVPPSSQPAFFSVRPRDNALLMGPKPNAVYVVSGDYYRAAPALINDSDTPIFPERFHTAIIWLAQRFYAGYEEDGGVYADANGKYNRVVGDLEIDQKPTVFAGAPLA